MMLQFWKEAATTLVFKRKSDTWKILMLERSGKSSFMPGMRVFPGGIASKVDFLPDWLDILSSTECKFGPSEDYGMQVLNQDNSDRPSMIKRALTKENWADSISANVGFRLCAIRETFEESGILLFKKLPGVKSSFSTDTLQEWRDKVNKNDMEFLNMCIDLNISPDIWNMHEWSNWLTPLHLGGTKKLRYDTMFYAAFLHDDAVALHDSSEVVSAEV